MSFYGKEKGKAFAPGWFLADNESCTRLTYLVGGDDYAGTVREADGRKVVPMGSLYPSTSAPVGIVYEDIDVKVNGNSANVIGKTKILASPFGVSKSWWKLRQDMELEKINGKWIIKKSVASMY